MTAPQPPSGPLDRNPGKVAGGIGAVVAALISLATAFRIVSLTDAQIAAILGAVAVVAPLAVGWHTDRRTTPYADPRDRDGQVLVPANPAATKDANPGQEGTHP